MISETVPTPPSAAPKSLPRFWDGLKFMGLIFPPYILGFTFMFSYEIWGASRSGFDQYIPLALIGLSICLMVANVLLLRRYGPRNIAPWRLALVALLMTVLCFACAGVSIFGSIYAAIESPVLGGMGILAGTGIAVGASAFVGRFILGHSSQPEDMGRKIMITSLVSALLVAAYSVMAVAIVFSTIMHLEPISAWLSALTLTLISSGIAAWTITRTIGHICTH